MLCWSGLLIHSFLLCVISDVISVSPKIILMQSYIINTMALHTWMLNQRGCMLEAGHTFIEKINKNNNAHMHRDIFLSLSLSSIKSYWFWCGCVRAIESISVLLLYYFTHEHWKRSTALHTAHAPTLCAMCCIVVTHTHTGTCATKISNAIVNPFVNKTIRNSLGNICILINYYWWRYVNSILIPPNSLLLSIQLLSVKATHIRNAKCNPASNASREKMMRWWNRKERNWS